MEIDVCEKIHQPLYFHVSKQCYPKSGETADKLLKCVAVSKEFGGLQALKNVDLTVQEGTIAGLVGPNGSGKSTLLNVISGVYKPDSGKILFMNEDISKLPPYKICAKGVAKTSQIVQSFPDMTTIENVSIASLFARKREGSIKEKATQLLNFVGLSPEKLNLPARNLNVVELRRVQLARALATEPKLLLLDELLTGLTPKECDEAIALVKLINENGVTILIVEHVMKVIMGLCEQVTVLHHGEKICEGSPATVCNDKSVIDVYLGKKFTFEED